MAPIHARRLTPNALQRRTGVCCLGHVCPHALSACPQCKGSCPQCHCGHANSASMRVSGRFWCLSACPHEKWKGETHGGCSASASADLNGWPSAASAPIGRLSAAPTRTRKPSIHAGWRPIRGLVRTSAAKRVEGAIDTPPPLLGPP